MRRWVCVLALLSSCGDDPVEEECLTLWFADGGQFTSSRCILPSRVEAVNEAVLLQASRYFDPIEVSGALSSLDVWFGALPGLSVSGVFRPPRDIEVDLSSDCIGATSYAHELSHAVLWRLLGDLTHDDPRFFVQRWSDGSLVDVRQRDAAVEVSASLEACEASCSGHKCRPVG